jgi:glucose/arabinose dehydrogenase
MRPPLCSAIVLAIFVAAGCGGKTDTPSPPPPGGTLNGGERLAWSQPGAPAETQAYQYALYVDGERRVLQAAACNPAGGDPADCTAPVPALSAGLHTLELAAFFVVEDTVIEGPRSAALQVTFAGVTATPAAGTVRGGTFTASDGLELRADVLAVDLIEPADLAVAPDGRVFVAERGGTIRIVHPEAGIDGAADGPARSPVLASGGAALLSLALDRDFATTRVLHVAAADSDRDRPRVHVVRVREAGETFGEAATTATLPTRSAAGSALLRTGPDGMLYVAIDAVGEPDSAQRLSEPAGKLLRLRSDGSTPDGNPALSPVLSSGHRDPRGLAWDAGGTLWEVERGDAADELNRIAAGRNYGWPDQDARRSAASVLPPSLMFAAGTGLAGIACISAANHPLDGALVVSAADAEDLLVVRARPDGRLQVTATLLERRFGRVGQVAADAAGALYFVTANAREPGTAEALIRLQARDR